MGMSPFGMAGTILLVMLAAIGVIAMPQLVIPDYNYLPGTFMLFAAAGVIYLISFDHMVWTGWKKQPQYNNSFGQIAIAAWTNFAVITTIILCTAAAIVSFGKPPMP